MTTNHSIIVYTHYQFQVTNVFCVHKQPCLADSQSLLIAYFEMRNAKPTSCQFLLKWWELCHYGNFFFLYTYIINYTQSNVVSSSKCVNECHGNFGTNGELHENRFHPNSFIIQSEKQLTGWVQSRHGSAAYGVRRSWKLAILFFIIIWSNNFNLWAAFQFHNWIIQ